MDTYTGTYTITLFNRKTIYKPSAQEELALKRLDEKIKLINVLEKQQCLILLDALSTAVT